MKLFRILLPLSMIIAGADAAFWNPFIRSPDVCYNAVAQPNNKQRTSDCESFLLTTITPKKANDIPTRTIYKTTTITKKTPIACSRIGVTAKTVNGPRVAVVSKIIHVKIPRASTVRTTVSATRVTQTVKTTVVLKTYSTEEVTKTIDIVTDDVTIATETVTETTTKTETAEPLQAVKLIAVGSTDPSLATSGSLGFSSLESSQGTSFYVDFNSDASTVQEYTIHKGTGEVKALNGQGSAAGQSASYNFSPGSGNSYGSVMIQGKGAPPLVCKVADRAGYQSLQCKFGSNQIADFWICKQRLLLVYPGYDLSRCYMDGNVYTGYKIPLIRVPNN
ncbi:hypothetical protein DER46DRAFT_630122 [Fusarium sp. MPI-SDFR-AT-0072]|nr:hypothetical protein DER46DRAFT_630122 [Fusarium sp. MPI-SDFR-AT-0072]